MDIKLIRAFIASPGGLDAERRAAHTAAEEVNASVARNLGFRLELIGWEETISGAVRAQEAINTDMETCDLFIGAMWASWGSRPALDGPYTSGFEEEFELSRERNRKTGVPLMAMFFKDVSEQQQRDPGDDLKKVFAFKQKLIDEKTFLFSTFYGPEDFARKVREFLSHHIIRLHRGEALLPREDRPRPEAAISAEVPVEKKERTDVLEAEFLDQMAALIRCADGPTDTDVARLRLIAASFNKAGNDDVLIGVHDANLLYAQRANFTYSFSEKRALVECGLAHLSRENIPLWNWLADLHAEQSGILVALTMFGQETVRVGALAVMRLLGEPLKREDLIDRTIVKTTWMHPTTPAAVKLAALAYLREFGTRDELEEVQKEADLGAKETVAAAIEAAVEIIARISAADAVRYILGASFETLDGKAVRQALLSLDELGSEELLPGLDHRSPEVRARTLEKLSERSALPLEMVNRATEDVSPMVRLAAIQALDRLGQPLSLDEAGKVLRRPARLTGLFGLPASQDSAGDAIFLAYRTERMRTMSLQSLEVLLGATEHREAAYRALAARRAGDFATRLRVELENGFRDYVERNWPDGVKSLYNSAAVLFIDPDTPEESKRKDLLRAALDVVAVQRDRADLPLVRRVLDGQGVAPSKAVIGYLKALGSFDDVARLALTSQFAGFGFAGEDPEDGFNEAAHAILKLASSRFAELVRIEMREGMRARLIDLVSPSEFAKLGNDLILGLLLSNDNSVRRATAKKIAGSVTKSRIRSIFASYLADEAGIYYLVTYWLDLGLAYPRTIARQIAARSR